VPNWLDLTGLFHAIRGGSEPQKKYHKIGKIRCFKPAYEKIPDVWGLYKDGIPQVEIGRRVFPYLDKRISSVRVHQLLDAANKMIYGKERLSGKKERRRIISKKYTPQELKRHLQSCKDCKNNLGKKRVSEPTCEWYKYIDAFVNRDTTYLREKILDNSVDSDK